MIFCMFMLMVCLFSFFFPFIIAPPPVLLVIPHRVVCSHNNWSAWFSMSTRRGAALTTVYTAVVCIATLLFILFFTSFCFRSSTVRMT